MFYIYICILLYTTAYHAFKQAKLLRGPCFVSPKMFDAWFVSGAHFFVQWLLSRICLESWWHLAAFSFGMFAMWHGFGEPCKGEKNHICIQYLSYHLGSRWVKYPSPVFVFVHWSRGGSHPKVSRLWGLRFTAWMASPIPLGRESCDARQLLKGFCKSLWVLKTY